VVSLSNHDRLNDQYRGNQNNQKMPKKDVIAALDTMYRFVYACLIDFIVLSIKNQVFYMKI